MELRVEKILNGYLIQNDVNSTSEFFPTLHALFYGLAMELEGRSEEFSGEQFIAISVSDAFAPNGEVKP